MSLDESWLSSSKLCPSLLVSLCRQCCSLHESTSLISLALVTDAPTHCVAQVSQWLESVELHPPFVRRSGLTENMKYREELDMLQLNESKPYVRHRLHQGRRSRPSGENTGWRWKQTEVCRLGWWASPESASLPHHVAGSA